MYEATKAKEQMLFREGYNPVVIWECEWDHKVKHDSEVISFLSTYEKVDPLEPRDAFFGGRTNAPPSITRPIPRLVNR